MQPLTLSTFIKESLLYLGVSYFYYYLPGRWILTKLRLTAVTPERIALPLITGILLFTLASYLASWVHSLPLVLLAIAAIVLWSTKNKRTYPLIDKKHRIQLLFVTILSVIWSLPKSLAGTWGNTFFAQADDTLHLAYSNELKAHFPPDNPGFASVALKGYHFFSDFLIATTSALSGISIESLYYHYFPLLVALGVGFGVYSLVVVWTKSKSAGLWGVLLAMFGGSFGFILRLQGHKEASLTSVFGIDQPSSALLNAPFATSLLLVTLALVFLIHYSRSGKIGWLYLLALVTGLSPMFKIYAGIILFSGFVTLVLIDCVRRRFRVLLPFVLAILFALATYGVFSGPGNYLILFPLWETHKVLTDSLPWFGFEEKYYTYRTLSVTRKLIELEVIGVALFVFGNLGTRLVGIGISLANWLVQRKSPSLFALVIATMTATSILIPLLFIQSVKVFEIIQIAWYYPFLTSLVAAYGLSLLDRRVVLIAIIIIMTLPSTYEIYARYVFSPKARRDIKDFQEYQFLRMRGTYDDTVLELPSVAIASSSDQLRAWFNHSSPHIPAFANKRSFLATMQIDFPNMNIDERIAFVGNATNLAASNSSELRDLLVKNNIRYIYSPNEYPGLETQNIKLVYRRSRFIYEVQ